MSSEATGRPWRTNREETANWSLAFAQSGWGTLRSPGLFVCKGALVSTYTWVCGCT